ncbi:MAG: PEP-CTERM sorting domain-containing protein [Verrucomicrobiota bacterium JB023]|nr:PEP-CTERM sorting domain-containing protein [Verrucomicrobiota bacterium JB023]
MITAKNTGSLFLAAVTLGMLTSSSSAATTWHYTNWQGHGPYSGSGVLNGNSFSVDVNHTGAGVGQPGYTLTNNIFTSQNDGEAQEYLQPDPDSNIEMIATSFDSQNDESGIFRAVYTITFSEPVEAIRLGLSQLDFARVRFTGSAHEEQVITRNAQASWGPSIRAFQDSNPATSEGNNDPNPNVLNSAYGTIELTPTSGSTFRTIQWVVEDRPNFDTYSRDGFQWTIFTSVETIPEPTSGILAALGGITLLLRRRRSHLS